MTHLFNPGDTVKVAGTYVEVRHGGGTIKNKYSQTVSLQVGETFPELKHYKIKYTCKNKTTERERQHKWRYKR